MFEIIQNLWNWYVKDIVGDTLLAGAIFAVIIYLLLASVGLPKKATLAFMIPVSFGFILMGYLSWVGWLIIMIVGMIFGALVYKFFE